MTEQMEGIRVAATQMESAADQMATATEEMSAGAAAVAQFKLSAGNQSETTGY